VFVFVPYMLVSAKIIFVICCFFLLLLLLPTCLMGYWKVWGRWGLGATK
jgi:hypothetical protein